MNNKILLPVLAASALFLSGCASTSRKTAHAPQPVPEPEPVQLAELPDYGTDKSADADKSAPCYLLPARTGLETDPLAVTFRADLRQGLAARGYTVIDSYNTAEERNLIKKQIMLVDYATRTHYLPVRKKTAHDVYLVLKVQDRPESVASAENARYFSVMARDISDQSDPNMTGALKKAVNNFFCLDSFCNALELRN